MLPVGMAAREGMVGGGRQWEDWEGVVCLGLRFSCLLTS